MATSRRKAADSAAQQATGTELTTEDLVEPGEETEHDAIAELRGMGVEGEYKYTVSKVAGKPGEKGGYCAVYGVGDLSLDTIREQFGGGKYRIRVNDASNKYVTMRTVEIVDLPKSGVSAAAALPATAGTDMQGIAALLQAVKPDSNGKTDMTPILIAMMDNQSKMFTALMSGMNNKPAGPTMMEMMALLKSTEQKTDPVALLMQGLELGKSLAGGGETDMLSVAEKGLGVLGNILEHQRTQPTAAPAVRARQPARLAAPATPAAAAAGAESSPNVEVPAAAPEGGNVRMLKQLEWFKAQLGMLLMQAQRKRDPELYAEVMLDNLPPYLTPEEILTHLEPDNAVDKLAQIEPRVAQFRPWFDEFRVCVIEFLTGGDGEEGEEGEEGEGEGEDAGPPDAPGEHNDNLG